MRALVWQGKGDIRCETVDDPVIEQDTDAILKVSSCAICGSDLHLMDGAVIGMEKGDVLGHEFMGEIVEVGSGSNLTVGQRVVVPFQMTCGECEQCRRGNFSVCERTNRNADMAAKAFGYTGAGAFGYSHLTGGYWGGQAEFVRVPFADTTVVRVPEGIPDEKLLFLGDILPTGWQAVMQCDIEPDDIVAIWGCGPVGQFCIQAARMLGAGRIIAIDRIPERLAMARANGAETINFEEHHNFKVAEQLKEMTGGKGPNKCIDAVGCEAHAHGAIDAVIDNVKTKTWLATDRAHVLREAFMACRPAGVVSVPGVYAGISDKIPFGAVMNKGLTIRTGQTHVRRWADDLLHRIEEGEIDPSSVITHTVSLEEGPDYYKKFRDKEDGVIKVVLKPDGEAHRAPH